MVWSPRVARSPEGGWRARFVGDRLVDAFLEFAACPQLGPNTVWAYAHDLKAFCRVVVNEQVEGAQGMLGPS
jgi:hypothetical protein